MWVKWSTRVACHGGTKVFGLYPLLEIDIEIHRSVRPLLQSEEGALFLPAGNE